MPTNYQLKVRGALKTNMIQLKLKHIENKTHDTNWKTTNQLKSKREHIPIENTKKWKSWYQLVSKQITYQL